MRKGKLNHIWQLFVLVFMLSACSDDFVFVNSEDANSETFFNTEEDYQGALIAAYDGLQWTYLSVMIGEIASNNTLAGGESAIDVPGIQEIDDMRHTPINEDLRSIWRWMYAAVNRTKERELYTIEKASDVLVLFLFDDILNYFQMMSCMQFYKSFSVLQIYATNYRMLKMRIFRKTF